jgi:ABC-type multidrug transport system ATPase subunit
MPATRSEEESVNNATKDGETILKVQDLWVRKGGLTGAKSIVKDLSFEVKRGEFVAIIGPNGAGKTKLLEAITGDRPHAGKVLLRNQDLYANPEYWLRRIGWVPSYNVLHDSLKVRQALLQIGKLRLPGRSERSIKGRIEALLDELEFPLDRREALIRNLSSGQRKRLDLCAELLTNPPLLLLDEPTTNLDPDAERSLMEMLNRRASENGQAILIVTHTLQSLYFCDRVLFIANGKIRGRGPYLNVLAQLEGELEGFAAQAQLDSDNIVDQILGQISEPDDLAPKDDASRWAAIYSKAKFFEREADPPVPPKTPPPHQARFRTPTRDWVHELKVLLKRNWMLFTNNLPALGLYLMLGPFSGLLSRIVLRDNAFIQNDNLFGYSSVFDTSDARQAIFILALVVTLLGFIGSFLDVTKEKAIYQYERVKGLSPWAYLLSKWIMLSFLVGVLAPSLMFLVLTFQGQQMPSPIMVWLTLILACIASVTLGLAISAASNSERAATGLLGIVVVFNLFFSGGVDFNERFQPILERISVYAVSHWAAEGISVSTQLYCWASNPRFQDFFSSGHLVSVWLFIVVYMCIAFALAFIALRLQEIWFSPRDRLLKAILNEHMLILVPVTLIAFSWATFLKGRSLDYYNLRAQEDNVRIENSVSRNLFQTGVGYVSQSLCPLPTPLPPPATPMVAIPPTSVSGDPSLQPQVALTGAPTASPTPLPQLTAPPQSGDSNLAPLPVGVITRETPILFIPGRSDFPLESLPANSAFILLGKDVEESWFRIKELHTGRYLVGWLPVDATNLPPAQTGQTASPPVCAAPRAYLEMDGLAPSAEWTSDVAGHVVTVVDLFRDQAGAETVPSQLVVEINDETHDTYTIQVTRQAFIFRGLAIDVRINAGDRLHFYLASPIGNDNLHLRASIFFVPNGCSF